MIGQDLIKKIDELNDNIIAANSIYAMSEQDLASRKAYAQKAIANGYQLQRKLSRLIRCVPSATAASLEEITSLLSQEIDDLKGWKKNDKIRADNKLGLFAEKCHAAAATGGPLLSGVATLLIA